MPITWLDSVIQALQNLGGESHLSEIYPEVKRIRLSRNSSWGTAGESSTRATLERHSSDTEVWVSSRPDLFQNRSIGQGIWALRDISNNLPVTRRIDSNHNLAKEFQISYNSDGSVVERASYTRTNRELVLQRGFEEKLRMAGFRPYSKEFNIYGTRLVNDIFIDEVNFLIEAKVYTENNRGRVKIREVLGQIKDYARYCEEYPKCAALVSTKPKDELIDLLLEHNIYCIWQKPDNSFEDNIPLGELFS